MAKTDLVIDGEQDIVVDGGLFRRLIVRNSHNVTVRNAVFRIAQADSVVSIQGSSLVRLEGSDLHGGGEACEGVSIVNSDDIAIVDNRIHDIADDGMEVFDADGLLVEGNRIYRLLGKGTDTGNLGPCYNGHSDGIELARVSNSVFRANLVFDVRSNAAVFLSNDASGPSQYSRNLEFTDNVFVTPESGFTFYAFQTDGLTLHNNTIWRGLYGGLAMGDNVTGFDAVNNVLHSINYAHMGTPYVPGQHHFEHNRVADVAGWNQTPPIFGAADGNTMGEPGFAGAPDSTGFGDPAAWRQPEGNGPLVFALDDFRPAPGSPLIDAGRAGSASATDALGTPRPQGAMPDIGAIEAL